MASALKTERSLRSDVTDNGLPWVGAFRVQDRGR
jgi:hypothetical protein